MKECPMLKPSEFYVGSVEQAGHLTLILPNKTYDNCALTFIADEKKYALFLDGEHRVQYHFVDCETDVQVGGIMVPGVEIELDPTSAIDGDGSRVPRGALIRHADALSVWTTFLGRSLGYSMGLMALQTDLPKGDNSSRAFFTRWQLVLGHGHEKRVLHSVNVTPEL